MPNFPDMRTHLRLPILLTSLILASCDSGSNSTDSSNATNATGTGLDGSWSYSDGAEQRDQYRFDGANYSFRSYYSNCMIFQETGTYSFSGDALRLNMKGQSSRLYQTDVKDSAAVCRSPMSTSSYTESSSVRVESVTATSFTTVTKDYIETETGFIAVDVRTTYNKD